MHAGPQGHLYRAEEGADEPVVELGFIAINGRAIHGMETAARFDWGTVTAEAFDCVIDWPQGRGSHLAGFSASMQCRPEQEKAKESGRAG